MHVAVIVGTLASLVASPAAAGGDSAFGRWHLARTLDRPSGDEHIGRPVELFRFQLDRSCGPDEAAGEDEGGLPSCAPPAENLMRRHIGKVRKAAEAGSAYDQFILGFVYWMGRRAPRDPVRARMWLSLAAGNGHPAAQWARAALAREMTAAEIAEAERLARAWLRKHYHVEPAGAGAP